MTSRLLLPVIDTADIGTSVAFWCAALGAEVGRRWTDAHGVEYVEIGPPGGEPVLLLQPVVELGAAHGRVHLDLAARSGPRDAEVQRLVALGATVVDDDPDQEWVVLADPEGTPFCVLPSR